MGSVDKMEVQTALSEISSMSDSPETLVQAQTQVPAQKRTAAEAGLKLNGMRPNKSVKRRASKACQCCRARKVRCNVVEHGAPCTNCRLDEVDCIVSESKRKKKWTINGEGFESLPSPQSNRPELESTSFPTVARAPHEPLTRTGDHVPHALYQDLNRGARTASVQSQTPLYTPNMLMNLQRLGQKTQVLQDSTPLMPTIFPAILPAPSLPAFIKPLPSRFGPDDIWYLQKKGALTIPPESLRNELLRCYIEFVHPYMPLLNVHELVSTVDRNDGSSVISLLLFQAVMFSAIATVDMRYLKSAGYATRRDARREFFQKTRLLYDFDYEIDRISLIQALLLMTYWYETPDDQKDSHHWMGIAVSLSHTIGLHRNPEQSNMDPGRQRLWKRIWWSTFMRDRLIALGMRRPTKIKCEDFDVPMLMVEDFEICALPDGPSCIPLDCAAARDIDKQRQLAIMCIEKAKLCICVSHVLTAQYSVLHNNHGVITEEGSTRTTMMLVAKKLDPGVGEVQRCDQELQTWHQELSVEALYTVPTLQDVNAGNECIILNRALLHMVYYAAVSALHRPQVLPSTSWPSRNTPAEIVEVSRKAVRIAASEITRIAQNLYSLDLVRYLPTTGITVLLPAIIIHLLDIKAPDEPTRRTSLQGFCQCMQIMSKLRDIYAAADYSTAFLEAAIRKAEITLPQKPNEVREPRNFITSTAGLVDAGRRMQLLSSDPESGHLTPPPDDQRSSSASAKATEALSDDEVARRLESYLTSTPPDSDHHPSNESTDAHEAVNVVDFDMDFDSFVNLDAAGEVFSLEDGALAAMQGESSGFTMDMDWMRGMKDDGLAALT